MTHDLVDLRSDTLTKPTPNMIRAMLRADGGDDCYGESSSVADLEEYCANEFGKQSAVFMPSGTMTNQIALRCLLPRGQELLCDVDYHINFFEASSASDLGGAAINAVRTPEGFLTPEIAKQALCDRARWTDTYASLRLVWTENTINGRGAKVYPLTELRRMYEWAQALDIPLFLDGARILNAVVATGSTCAEWGAVTTATSLCFAKGLGAPMGSVLMGDHDMIRDARRFRKWYGGALHQAGPMAAAALWAFKRNLGQLAADHEAAQAFASVLQECELLSVNNPETNMVLFDVRRIGCPPAVFVNAVAAEGVAVLVWSDTVVRAVFCSNVDVRQAVDAARRISRVAEKLPGPSTSSRNYESRSVA